MFAAKTVWTNEQLLTSRFDHFLKFTPPANCNTPNLLILDGHSSHAKNSGVGLCSRWGRGPKGGGGGGVLGDGGS